MSGRMRARCKRRMTNDCFRVGMGMMSIAKNYAVLKKIAETTFVHTVQLAADEITAQLIDRYLKDKLRSIASPRRR